MLPLFRPVRSFASWSATSTKRDDLTPGSILEKPSAIKLSSYGNRPAASTNNSAILPTPVSHDPTLSGHRSRTKKNARVSHGLRVHWDRFVRKLGSGTAPSSSSNWDESAGESGDSSGYPRSRIGGAAGGAIEMQDERVDEVVVDREWSDEIKSSSVTHSEHAGTPDKSGSNHLGGTNTDRDSFAVRPEGFWGSAGFLIFLRWRLWPFIHAFFQTRFMDEKSEMHYAKENWFLRKNLALWSSAFLVVNWAFGVGFVPRPILLADQIFLYGVAPVFTFLIPPMVIYDWPRDRNTIYQVVLFFATWIWAIYQIIFIYLCGSYNVVHSHFNCNNKDFLTLFYYTSALQTIALFGLKLHRFPALLGALLFLALSFALVVPDKASFLRSLVNVIFFQGFLLYLHYMRENAERRLYTLRDQLKVQFRATQKAQVNERKAADSKRRLTSGRYAQVRVPLNTALLAVQNMQASGALITQDIEFKALEGSLSMMSKVLNDVLDFNRMDSGRFESVLKPYKFHQVMRSLFVPLRLATDARRLEFVTDLDPVVDNVARRALYEAMGETDGQIKHRLESVPSEDGIVVGDETRLRQIITNLASNACKFTPAGGKLTIRTRLVLPERYARYDESDSDGDEERSVGEDDLSSAENGEARGDEPARLSKMHLKEHDVLHTKNPPLEWIVVRIEVSDTGYGIRPKDMVQSKLFSAFNQTEQGRLQGGKGTGLGLALVRQIVKLSGGRLGVQSKVNEGSTFWVELPLGVGSKSLPALTSAGDLDDDDWVSSRHSDTKNPLPKVPHAHFRTSGQFSPSYSSSALHSIMEQGGLVEISTKPTEAGPPTRTIGDPSTGTDPHHDPETPGVHTDRSSPPLEAMPQRPSPMLARSSQTVTDLQLTHLPNPGTFTIDGALVSPAPTAGSSGSGAGPPHGANGSSIAGGNGAAVQYETKLNVLVVDDDPLTRKLMSRMLTRLGCRVTTAENGEVALELILTGTTTHATPSSEDTGSGGLSLDGALADSVASVAGPGGARFAVVFLDNQMPVMSGLEAVTKLRELGRGDFVVGVTGNALLADQQEYLEAGVDHVLTKPVLEKSLRSMLAMADDRRRRGP
ncbi:uncharacterized protein BXZ73DRAFT_44250 [Epithele typhae]|uniref:uncharacterized protein n=1 Tax=Epithele typhae TaxID=378194 RepID=UPI00200851C9|nr:uncharacterized protein BXZ73DRAFT_44250 [Epithele typhae]KAH9939060.1 hypothetical protein BXZ73DRAFT_44250 [Epithele typhae]